MTLPGMPIRYGDPGVFICKIDDGAPRVPRDAKRVTPAPAPAGPTSVWFVMEACWRCTPKRGYCDKHGHAYLDFWASLGI